MELLLIRHGESEADLLRVHEGRADFSLTELGLRQVEAMARRVNAEFPPEIIYASTLRRARQTAERLAAEVGCELVFYEELMEYNNGAQAGLPLDGEQRVQMPTLPHVPIEGGESDLEFRLRAEMIFSQILTENAERERIAIVAHGGIIKLLLHAFLQLPVHAPFDMWTGDTGIHHLVITPTRRRIQFLNSLDHLRDLQS